MLGWFILIVILLLIAQSGGKETESLTLFVGIAGLILMGFSTTIIVFLCLVGTQGANRFGLLASSSGRAPETFGRASAYDGAESDLGASHWVLSGFDSVGTVIRLEFDVTSGRNQVYVIGRNREVCDLVISDQGVSRQHAEILVSSSGV